MDGCQGDCSKSGSPSRWGLLWVFNRSLTNVTKPPPRKLQFGSFSSGRKSATASMASFKLLMSRSIPSEQRGRALDRFQWAPKTPFLSH